MFTSSWAQISAVVLICFFVYTDQYYNLLIFCFSDTHIYLATKETNFSLPPRSEQVSGAHANEVKHDHSPVVIVVLDPRYDKPYTVFLYLKP